MTTRLHLLFDDVLASALESHPQLQLFSRFELEPTNLFSLFNKG